jgi:arabinogalactan oligomer / maltooligosaccharide transport system permease protein
VTTGLVAKLLLLGTVNAVALYGLPRLYEQRAWFGLSAVVLATVAINAVYLTRRAIPAKYLIPGTVFLVAFQVYPVLYTGFIAFTNYGTGNILTKTQAVEVIERASVFTPPDAVRYRAQAVEIDGELGLLLTDPDGDVWLGTADGLVPADPDDEALRRIPLREAQDRQRDLESLRIPVDDGEIRLSTFTAAVRREQRLVYDADADTLIDQETDEVFRADVGNFVGPDGRRLTPGWREVIGFDHFARVFTSPAIRGPFLRVFLWTFSFAVLTVVGTFFLGLALALTFNHPAMRGRRLYRSLLIIPYALPSFMTALVWRGMLNREFGIVNQMLDASIPWLTHPHMAKVSIILVNLWLGFPYMFLITTGALQSIPSEVREAAAVDGASAFQAFRKVTLPLLLVAVAPLLIASFAFNFNNFNVIYMLTQGRPPIPGATTPAGHTDILITYTYRLAFEGGRGADYGFAAAISIIIFFLVATISILSFRRTRVLEEIN